MTKIRNSSHWIAACGLVASLLIAVILYWGGLSGPFVLDDRANVQNSYVEHFDWDEIIYETTHNTSGRLGRPVSILSFIASGLMHGSETWGYKFHNLMLHLLNGLLIFWLFSKLLPHINSHLKPQTIWLIAGATAACWLLHPLMVSTVLYVVQRMAQLSAFFTLAALLVYVFARESVSSGAVRYYSLAYVAFPLCLMFAVLSKEDGALIPIYAIAIEFIVFRFNMCERGEKFRVISFLAVFIGAPVLAGSLYLVTHLDQFTNFAGRDFTVVERVMSQFHVLLFYVKLILVPAVSDMSLFHDSWPVTRQWDIATCALAVFWCVVAALVFYCRKKAPVISLGIAWFLISHLMESTIFNLELVFEHRNYLATAGLLLIVIYYLFTNENRAFKVLPIVMIAVLAFMTHARVTEWQSPYTFYTLGVNDHPDSYRANTEYANYILRTGDRDRAIQHLQVAQDLVEKDYGAYIHHLFLMCNSGEMVEELYKKIVERAEKYPISVYSSNGIDVLNSYVNRGNCPELSQGQLLTLIRLAQAQENNMQNSRVMGYLKRQEGIIHFYNGDVGQGIDAFTMAYNDTREFQVLAELVEILLQYGQIESAENTMEMLERIDEASWRDETFKINQLYTKIEENRLKKSELSNESESAQMRLD